MAWFAQKSKLLGGAHVQTIDMAFAGGVLGVDQVDDALQPRLGFAVVWV